MIEAARVILSFIGAAVLACARRKERLDRWLGYE